MSEPGKIIDFEAKSRVRMLERVRELTMARDALIETAKANHVAQAQVHAAILGILDAKSWADLDARLRGSVRASLCLDHVGLVVECPDLPDLKAVRSVSSGHVSRFMQDQFQWLGPVGHEGKTLYGIRAGDLRSQALLRIHCGEGEAVLCFASKDRNTFQGPEGTDLIAFFAKVVERLIHDIVTDHGR